MKTLRLLGILLAVVSFVPLPGCTCNTSKTQDQLVLGYDPESIDYPIVPVGESWPITVTLTHKGDSGTILLSDWTLDGTSPAVEIASPPDKTELLPGESTTLTVTFTPTSPAIEGGDLVIRHNVMTQGNGTTRIPITSTAPVADLIAQPNPIAFGQVHSCTPGEPGYKDLDVKLVNAGSDSARILGIRLDAEGSPDFTREAIVGPNGDELPVELGPNQSIGVTIRYEPRGGGSDFSKLFVDGEQKGEARQWAFTVTGSELGPKLIVAPAEVNFGWVPLDTVAEFTITLQNKGSADLTLKANGMNPSLGSDPEIKMKEPLAEDLVLAPDQDKSFVVTWTAKNEPADPAAPIGGLSIESTDCESPLLMKVYGRIDAPCVDVSPNPLDFGFGAKLMPVQRLLTVANNCHGKLGVTGMEIINPSNPEYGQEFVIVADPNFPPTTGVAGEVAGNESKGVALTFTNRGPDVGSASATLVIHTNQKGKETINVPLTAQRTKTAECRLGTIPATVAFGVQGIGSVTEKQFNIVNTGTGPCTIQQIAINDCKPIMDMFGIPMGLECKAPFTGTTSTVFTMKDAPPVGTQLIAGQTWIMKIVYAPPKDAPMFGALNDYQAVLGIKYKDDTTGTITTIPKGTTSAGTTTYKANVTGQSGTAKVSILPAEVKYGVTTIGCYSKTFKICVYNSGNAPLQLQDARLEGCTPEFHLKNVPPLPKNVPPGAPVCFETNYSPLDPGKDKCRVVVESSDPSAPALTVPLSGEGTYDTKQCDNFTQVSGQEVDILFIIDDSGSMCEHQDTLIKNYGNFIQHAAVWKNDYHLGIITVNVVDDKVMGKLNKGLTKPTFITNAMSDAQAKFQQYADVGCDGGSDAQESGLEAAQVALTAPLITDTGVACSSDATCKNDPNICPDPTTCALQCMDGVCGGWNRGFLRENAQLELIILSDEEDQSPASLPFYIDFLKNIKGFYNAGMMHVNAIVWDNNACQGQSSQGTGQRYLEVVKETGGQQGLICQGDYGPVMDQIGAQAFTLKVQFFLTRLADPSTVKVKVNGTACNAGPKSWKYDAPSNAIVFVKAEDGGTCMPQVGDKVDVCYDVLCLTS